jgi:hypothetical protein
MISPMLFSKMTGPFRKLWRGEQSLPKAFWLYFILIGILLAPFIAMVCAVPFVLLDQPQAAWPVFFATLFVYPVFAAVGVWRSANVYLFKSPKVYAVKVIYVVGTKIAVCIILLKIVQRLTGVTFIGLLKSLS